MSANGAGTSLTNDILGNRTGLGSSVTYGWDCLNRMTSYNGGTATSYAYRADGMRVTRAQGSNTDRFRYDGQMPFETAQSIGATQTIENGLGARGIDISATISGSGTIVSFPLYDAHGNQVETISRSGSSYGYSNQRSFGVWGEVRQGAATGGPKGRYCAALGHTQDDESGLIYMRARYYEQTSGRFLSQDKAGSGQNWFVYAANDPENQVDGDGCFNFGVFVIGVFLAVLGSILMGVSYIAFLDANGSAAELTKKLLQYASMADINPMLSNPEFLSGASADLQSLVKDILAARAQARAAKGKMAGSAITALLGYIMIIESFLLDDQTATDGGPGITETAFGGS